MGWDMSRGFRSFASCHREHHGRPRRSARTAASVGSSLVGHGKPLAKAREGFAQPLEGGLRVRALLRRGVQGTWMQEEKAGPRNQG